MWAVCADAHQSWLSLRTSHFADMVRLASLAGLRASAVGILSLSSSPPLSLVGQYVRLHLPKAPSVFCVVPCPYSHSIPYLSHLPCSSSTTRRHLCLFSPSFCLPSLLRYPNDRSDTTADLPAAVPRPWPDPPPPSASPRGSVQLVLWNSTAPSHRRDLLCRPSSASYQKPACCISPHLYSRHPVVLYHSLICQRFRLVERQPVLPPHSAVTGLPLLAIPCRPQ